MLCYDAVIVCWFNTPSLWEHGEDGRYVEVEYMCGDRCTNRYFYF